ncbi:MAG TPA: VOC family protein [Verrucomicrobiae bacterium]|jgi:PhnB protein
MSNEHQHQEGPSTFFAAHLTVRNVLAEMEYCKAAFGAVELRRFSNSDGSVHVGEMAIDRALFHLHEEMPGSAERSPETLKGVTSLVSLFVKDPTAVMKRAIAAGGQEIHPVKDYDYGYRQGTMADPAGHRWLIQKRI